MPGGFFYRIARGRNPQSAPLTAPFSRGLFHSVGQLRFRTRPGETAPCRAGARPRRLSWTAGRRGRPYNKTGNVPAWSPTPRRPPTRGALPLGADGFSTAHGRQQAGLGRVGSRSAGRRGRQGAGFEEKEIFKDHGSLNRSLVTFCRPRKSLALRRKYLYPPATHFRYRGFHPL